MSLHAIGKQLRVQRNTVRRYARAATAEEMLTQNPKRGSQLDPFTGYLAMRWEQDCTNGPCCVDGSHLGQGKGGLMRRRRVPAPSPRSPSQGSASRRT
jgi:hypothetical protein